MNFSVSTLSNGIRYAIIACFAFFVFLNPYLAVPVSIVSGQIVAICVLLFFGLRMLASKRITIAFNFKLLITTLFIMIYPHIVLFLREGQLDLNLLKIQISISVMVLLGFYIGFTFKNYHNLNALAISISRIFVGIIIFNSIIVLLEFYNPPIRLLLESFLIPDGKVDYANGLRFRGLASAGGASLSVAHGLCVPLLYYLFRKNSIGPLVLLLSVSVIFASLIFIGRSGFVVALLGILIVFILTKSSPKKTPLWFRVCVLIIFIAFLFSPRYVNVFFNSLPSHYQNYSINVFLGGADSLKSEGTISYVTSFYKFPDDFLSLVFGRGDFSGGFDLGYAWPGDPGIMKVMTAYGILGLFFYLGLILWLFSFPKSYLKDILIISCILLISTELKEPLLFKGYSSRFFWLLVGVVLYQRGLLTVRRSLKFNT